MCRRQTETDTCIGQVGAVVSIDNIILHLYIVLFLFSLKKD